MFPYALVQAEFDSFASVFVKTLEISTINVDSLTIGAP